MNLSLQKKINLRQFYHIRASAIKELVLHIDDTITYSKFQQIYNAFGKGYDEETFARYALDIGTNKFYNLSSGKVKTTSILTREYVSADEIESIRKDVLVTVTELKLKDISYDKLLELHKQYGGRLSLKFFAEEFLDVTPHSVDCMKSYGATPKILKGKNYDVELVRKIKEDVIQNANVHINDEISLDEFRQIYKQFGQGIDEKIFALKVLEANTSQVNKFLKGDIKKTAIFSNYIVNPEEIYLLREKVIKKEHLHIDDSIDNKRFLKLYKKYAGILDRDTFAEEILDISAVGVKNMRVSGTNSLVLKDIEVPNEYIFFLRNKIVKKENLAEDQMLEREQFFKYYKKYAGVLSKKQFALDVLKISPDSLSPFLSGVNKKTTILSGEKITDFEVLRKKVIKENFLHYDDKIDYYQFKAIYDKYGGNIPEYIFAERILDINSSAYANICFDKGKNRTFILSREKLPTPLEFELLKNKVLLENKLHFKDKIKFDKFDEIHRKYGGIIPDYIFADKIFGIRKTKLAEMSKNHELEVTILPAAKVPIKELKTLRRKVKKDNKLEPKKEISLANFEKWYSQYKHVLSPIMFARGVLGVHRQNLNKLKHGDCETVLAYQADDNLEKLPWVNTKKDLLEDYHFVKTIEKSSKKIIEDYKYTPKNVEKIKTYLQMCANETKNRRFSREDILFLDECVEFVVGGVKEISNFVKVSVSAEEYELGARCISKNIDNEGITGEERTKLLAMKVQLNKSSKRKAATNMVFNNDATDQIINRTGLTETEISKLRRKIHGNSIKSKEKEPKTI